MHCWKQLAFWTLGFWAIVTLSARNAPAGAADTTKIPNAKIAGFFTIHSSQ
jgi:hypothetical protein